MSFCVCIICQVEWIDWVGCCLFLSRAQLAAAETLPMQNTQLKAAVKDSDVVAGVYEGGFKLCVSRFFLLLLVLRAVQCAPLSHTGFLRLAMCFTSCS